MKVFFEFDIRSPEEAERLNHVVQVLKFAQNTPVCIHTLPQEVRE